MNLDFDGVRTRILSKMDYRNIIADSWKYTQGHKKLIRWLGFFPALFTTTVSIATLLYQFFAFKESYLFNEHEASFAGQVVTYIYDFGKDHVSWTMPAIIFAIIFGIIYFLFPTLAKASSIQIVAREKNGQKVGISEGIRHGAFSLLPLIEYHALIKTFSFFSILVEASFVIRNLGVDLFLIFSPIFVLFILLGLVLTLLFTYSDFYIVVDGDGVFESMKKSARLVIMHWKHTFLISILMLIIGVRIILQVVLVFLIPTLIIVITGYLSIIFAPAISIVIGGTIGLVALVIAAYLNGVVDIFSYTVWTQTFLTLSAEKEVSARETLRDEIGEGPQVEDITHPNLQ